MNKYFLALLLLVSTTLTGCISYSQHELPPVEQWPPAQVRQDKPTAYLQVSAQHHFNGELSGGVVNSQGIQKSILETFNESGQFKSVTTDKVDSNLYITSLLTNNEQGNVASAWLTGFTLFLIPTTFSNTLTLETVFKDQDGKVLGKIVKQESTRTWMQILLIVGAPFNERGDVLLKHLTQSTLDEAIKRKLI
ncbi:MULTISPECIES: hypothetical protein [unclassified Pseudomonas]|uniref:hypothetical protein n=1 Tax=unclassified Pseudomonas TaxID=196821 RepID=UPI002AC8C858|nr:MULTISPECIES: hypothetical protein [unclassified Pseudomonas]MEB0045952.1 hypothetical protein [Pseudomonas sp. Dout3]MEB0097212.1 hypothetical protein [Pseudomonas sp. DC1.2]WPX56850.1 hypothetical protein RHM68_14395 [Pseudomonas sp. DC1.2]